MVITGTRWFIMKCMQHSLSPCTTQADPSISSLATPSIKANQGVWTSYGSAVIQSPAKDVWLALRDFQSWGQWNEYTPKVETPSGTNDVSVGERVIIHFRAAPTDKLMAVPCLCMAVDETERVFCARGEPPGVPNWLLLPEKVHRVIARGENECLYEIFETQSGPMSYVVKWMMGAKQSAMNRGIADALKKHVEAR